MSIGVFGRGRLATAIREEARDPLAWMLGRDAGPGTPVSVAIDASSAAAVPAHLRWALATGTDLVIAATGWSLDDLDARVGARIGVVVAPNGSLTVALLQRLARILGRYGREVEGAEGFLLDHHHRAKRDAPSGTALRLADAWRQGADSVALSVASLRAGHEVGSHVLGLDAPAEQLTVEHRARSRAVFAQGLLRAAAWIRGRRGLFTMDDVARATLDPIFGAHDHGNDA